MDPYTIERIDDGFFSIDEGGVRCFLIAGAEDALLVDTGFGKGDLQAAARTLTSLPVKVFQTHADRDHTGCTKQFDRVFMHPAEYDYYSSKDGLCDKLLPVWEGDEVVCGTYRFRVLHIPGHTPGSIALLEESRRFLIAGDSVQSGAIFMFGPGRNMAAYLASMRKLDASKGLFDTVLASHGDIKVPAGILTDLIDGAGQYLAGRLTGKPIDRPLPCMLYEYRRAKFLCK